MPERPNEEDDSENVIIVEADRIDDDSGGDAWDWGDFFDFVGPGTGGGGSGSAPPDDEPEDEQPDEEEPTIIVNGTRPSEGQENFADDGNPFNDGAAPTYQTLMSWLQGLLADGVTDEIIVTSDNNNRDKYEGEFEDNVGNLVKFESDGEDQYYLFTQPAEPSPFPGAPMDPPPPIDPNDIALGPLGGPGYDLF